MSFHSAVALLIGAAVAGLHGSEARAQAGSAPPAIVVPTDPVERAAFDMLDTHCARCHQDGKLGQKLKAAGRFGNVLMMSQMAVDANLVVPGNPDASLLFNIIAQEKMPYDVFQDMVTPTPPEPKPEELQALRTWIEALGKTATASCSARKFVKNTDTVSLIAADLQGQRDFRVKGMRYLTFGHLYNACVDDGLMEGYRQAAVKLLNSLSSKTDVVRLETIDPQKTIVRFNIDDLGWTAADWDTILAAYPYGSKPEGQLFSFLSSATGSALPYLRADWFAFAAGQPPLYDVLLKLPDTAQGLEKKLGIDTLANIAKLQVQRAGFQRSGVSANNRMIERHTTASGYFWTSYDFAGNKEKQSLFKHPLGPASVSSVSAAEAFGHDGGESIFSLPNGFQGYYLSDHNGKQLKTGPTAIVRDPSRRDLAVTNGISCFGCHDSGIRKVRDDVRAQVLRDRSFPKSARDAVEAMYIPNEQMDAILDADLKRFVDAMRRAGLDPSVKPNGIEMINALSKRYEDMLDLRSAAAEFGMTPEAFKDAAAGAGPRALGLARRVDQGLVPRDTFEGEFPEIVAQINDEESLKGKVAAPAAAAAVPTVAVTPATATSYTTLAAVTVPVAVPKPVSGAAGQVSAFDLALTSNKSVYQVNDQAVLSVTSKKSCNLTLINVDGSGTGTIIFPNRFQQDNRIEAGKIFTFGDGAAFKFRLADKGTETVVAECNASKTASRGLEANHKAGGFTDLGDYTKRVTRQISVDGAARRQATRKIVVEAANKDPGAEAALKPSTGVPGAVTSVAPSDTDSLARTAIKFEVR